MTFNLRIGDEDRILQEQQEQKNGSQGAAALSDFVVLPHSGTLPPNFQLPIEVQLRVCWAITHKSQWEGYS